MLSMRAILYLRDGGPAHLPIPAVSPRLQNAVDDAVLFTPLLSPPFLPGRGAGPHLPIRCELLHLLGGEVAPVDEGLRRVTRH